jgi:peptidoglycan/xylan/chitin deacetylase (PgdA/CDA1 family)
VKRHIKMAVSACVFAGSMASDAMRRAFGSSKKPNLTILYYHGVPKDRLASFERQMAMLARRARVVEADWDGDGSYRAPADRRPIVAITFDDALDSVFHYAVPVLAAHGFHCTIFVPSGWLGQSPSWSMDTEVDCTEHVAGTERLSQVRNDLVTIGSHTVTHPHLSALSIDAARREVVQSMRDLTAITGGHVRSLAFPYGDHDDPVIELCRSVGYTRVYTIKPVPVLLGQGAFVRGRVAVGPGDGPFEFWLKLTGSYRWMPLASAIKRKLSLCRTGRARRRSLAT